MKKNKIIAIVLGISMSMALMVTGCGSSNKGGATSDAGSTGENKTEDTTENTSEGTTEGNTQTEKNVLLDSSNDMLITQVIGAETVEREGKTYLRVYVERTNLTDQILYAQPSLIAYQEDAMVYVNNHGTRYLKDNAQIEGAEDKEGYWNAVDFLVTRGHYIMPGVTKCSVYDILLNSDSDVKIKLSSGELTEDVIWSLADLPGAPASMQRVAQVADPEKWKDAVVSYTDSGIVNVKRKGEFGIDIVGAKLVHDGDGVSPTGKVVEVTYKVTNNTEEEQKAESIVDGCNIAFVIQDGVNLQSLYGVTSSTKTVVAPGETVEITIPYLSLSDDPVFVVIGTGFKSAYPADKTEVDNYGMTYTFD